MPEANRFPIFQVVVTTLLSSGYPLRLRPQPGERAAIAEAAGVTAFALLEADLVLRRWRRDGVEIAGELRARCEQPCVVTLEPVFQEIVEPIKVTYLPEGSGLALPRTGSDRELVLDPEGEDPPETFSGDSIDVWPVVFEMLSLAIDPFPRAPGAGLPPVADETPDDGEARLSPFAALKALKTDEN